MWNNKEQYMMVPSQRMNHDIASDRPFPTEELRKRKAMDFDFHSSFYADHLSKGESYLQQSVVTPQETNSHWKAAEEFFSYKLQPAINAFNTQSQIGNSQFCNLSNLPTIMHTKCSNMLEGAIGGFNSITDNEKESSFSSMAFSAGVTTQSPQCLNSDTISYGRDHANYGMPIKPHQFPATPQCLNNDAISHGNYDSNNISVDHLNMRYREQSHTIVLQKTMSLKPINNEQLSLNHERVENIGQSSENSLTKTLEKESSSKSKDAYSSEEMVTKQVEIGDKLPSQCEQTKSTAGHLSPIITEKLWDGFLQLNTSTMVSALAFFKSGEKTQDIKWPELVEIKGKVRLQAFEKFIQELPRSRNRSLMVISLCWKVGSSKSGLTGMKEVAKGYRENEKVGFAHICAGYDLYVCPRSDKIITILAKHGFFKGIMVVEEDQDSMIGCVIWRRSHQSSNTGPKKSDARKNSSLEKPLPCDEPLAVEVKCPVAEPTSCSKESEGASSKVLDEGTNNIMTEGVLIQSNRSLSDTSSSKTNIIEPNSTNSIMPTSEVRKRDIASGTSLVFCQQPQLFSLELNKQATLPGPPPFRPDVLQRVIQSCITEQKEPTGIPLNVLPLVSQTKDGPRCPDDDDDLPEFDFNDACGVQMKNPASNLPPLNRQLQVEKANMGSFVPPKALNMKLSEVIDPALPTLSFRAESLNTHEGVSVLAKYGNYVSENRLDSITAITNQSLQRKSSWNDNNGDDDDDDMPEWCPPEFEHIKQLQPSIPNEVPCDAMNGAPHLMYPPLPQRPLSPSKNQDFLRYHQRGILGAYPSTTESARGPDESPPPGFACLSRRPSTLHERNRSLRHETSRPDIKPRRSGPHRNHRSSKGSLR